MMNGNQIYTQKYDEMVESVIKKHPEQFYLAGYANFITTSCTTRYAYVNHVSRFMKICQKEPQELTLDDYTGYLRSLNSKTSSYQITVYAALKIFSVYLDARDINKKNPMQYIKRPKFIEGITTKQKRDKGYLSEEEIEQYITDVQNCIGEGRAIEQRRNWKERDLAIILLFLNTGMRCAALYKLNVDSIDFAHKTLITVDKEAKIQEHFLSKEMIEVLKDWLIKREELLEDSYENALFISSRRARMSEKSIARVVEKYAQNIKGKHITPHKLRATYGTQIYNKTHDIYLVQKCMDHASPTTSELYIRGNENTTRKQGAEIMSNLIFKKGN